MKKLLFTVAALVIAIGILYISVDRSTTHVRPSLAAASLKFEVQPSVSPTVVPPPKVEYYLVYPGLLPDHPLYRVKMIRDRVWLWLASNPLKKADLFLLYADKRLGAGKVLVEGNKVALGVTTLWKGEKYLEKVAEEIVKAKDKNLSAGIVSQKAKISSLKHLEVLGELKEKLSPEGKASLEEVIKFSQEIQKRFESL